MPHHCATDWMCPVMCHSPFQVLLTKQAGLTPYVSCRCSHFSIMRRQAIFFHVLAVLLLAAPHPSLCDSATPCRRCASEWCPPCKLGCHGMGYNHRNAFGYQCGARRDLELECHLSVPDISRHFWESLKPTAAMQQSVKTTRISFSF